LPDMPLYTAMLQMMEVMLRSPAPQALWLMRTGIFIA
jgi:hypothetical protein